MRRIRLSNAEVSHIAYREDKIIGPCNPCSTLCMHAARCIQHDVRALVVSLRHSTLLVSMPTVSLQLAADSSCCCVAQRFYGCTSR